MAKDYTAIDGRDGHLDGRRRDAQRGRPDTAHPGHLVNGSFFLPQALQAKATKADTSGTAYNDVSGNPLNLLTWNAPVSNDAVTLGFQQRIAANDALRTGSYSKTLTFTLSTTNP